MDIRHTQEEADEAISQSRDLVRNDKPEEAIEELRRAWNGLRIYLSWYDSDEDTDEEVDSILGLLDVIADEAATVWDRYNDQMDAASEEDPGKDRFVDPSSRDHEAGPEDFSPSSHLLDE